MTVYNIIEGEGAMLNEPGEEQSLKTGDIALVSPEGLTLGIRDRRASSRAQQIIPDEKHQYCIMGDRPFKMICGVPMSQNEVC